MFFVPFISNEEAKKYNNIRKITYFTTEKKRHLGLYTKTINSILTTKHSFSCWIIQLAISQNNPTCGAEEQQNWIRKATPIQSIIDTLSNFQIKNKPVAK